MHDASRADAGVSEIDAFVVKLSEEGTVLWSFAAGGPAPDRTLSVGFRPRRCHLRCDHLPESRRFWIRAAHARCGTVGKRTRQAVALTSATTHHPDRTIVSPQCSEERLFDLRTCTFRNGLSQDRNHLRYLRRGDPGFVEHTVQTREAGELGR